MMNDNNRNRNLDNETRKIVGVFMREEEASQAIRELKDAGFSSDDISVVGKNREDIRNINEETGTKAPEGLATGAATGGVIGGVAGLLAGLGLAAIPIFGPIMAAGPIAVTLAGAAAGAGAGGLVGGLIGLGIPEEEAREYEANVNEGNILVMVDSAAGNRDRIYDVFRRNNATNSRYFDAHIEDTTTVSGAPGATATTAGAAHMSGVFTTEESQERMHNNEDSMLTDRDRTTDMSSEGTDTRDRLMNDSVSLSDDRNTMQTSDERMMRDRDEDTGMLRDRDADSYREADTGIARDPYVESDVNRTVMSDRDMAPNGMDMDQERLNRTGQPTGVDMTGTTGAMGANMANTGPIDRNEHVNRNDDESLIDKGKEMLQRGKDKIDHKRD